MNRPYFAIILGSEKHSEFLRLYIEPFYEKSLVIGFQNSLRTKYTALGAFGDWTDPEDSSNIAKIKLEGLDTISFSIENIRDTKFYTKLNAAVEGYFITLASDSIKNKRILTDISVRIDSVRSLKRSEEYFVTLVLPKINEQKALLRVYFYQEIPEWISEWSTDCDNNISGAQKVYQLNRWINNFIYADLSVKSKTLFVKDILVWR